VQLKKKVEIGVPTPRSNQFFVDVNNFKRLQLPYATSPIHMATLDNLNCYVQKTVRREQSTLQKSHLRLSTLFF